MRARVPLANRSQVPRRLATAEARLVSRLEERELFSRPAYRAGGSRRCFRSPIDGRLGCPARCRSPIRQEAFRGCPLAAPPARAASSARLPLRHDGAALAAPPARAARLPLLAQCLPYGIWGGGRTAPGGWAAGTHPAPDGGRGVATTADGPKKHPCCLVM